MSENERVNVTPGPRCGLEVRVLVSLLTQCPAGNSFPGRGIERGRGSKFFLFSKDPFSALLSVSFHAKERSFDTMIHHYILSFDFLFLECQGVRIRPP